MSYINQDLTIHLLEHTLSIEGCEFCEQRDAIEEVASYETTTPINLDTEDVTMPEAQKAFREFMDNLIRKPDRKARGER